MNRKNPKIAECKLCLQIKKLCRSHILPEFLFKPLYNKDHKFHEISNLPQKKNRMRQIGIWEYLLCKECEAILQKNEDYVFRLLHQYDGKRENYRNAFLIYDVDYKGLKLFQLSLLWRVVISNRREFKHVKIAPKHQEKLRNMLLSDDPGRYYEYGCMLAALFAEGKLVEDLIMKPEQYRKEGHEVVQLICGGFIWLFIISSHMEKFPHKESFLSSEGRLVIYKKDIFNIKFFKDFASEIYDFVDLV